MAEAIDSGELLHWLRSRQDEFTSFLLRLVAAESPTNDPRTDTAIGMVADELDSVGYEIQRVPGHGCGSHLYARPHRRPHPAPHQLVVGHVDTIWPMGTLRTMPARVEDGRLYGPGSYDMKGGLAQLVFALRAIRHFGVEPSVTPVVLVTADEEAGSFDSARWIRRLARGAERAFVLEPPDGIDGKLKTSRKGVGRFKISISGRAAHAGNEPEGGVSAILELARQVTELFALNDPHRGVTVNVGTIDGGLSANVVAPEAVALVDARAPTREAADELERAIRSLKPGRRGLTVRVEGGFNRPPMPSSERNQALARRARLLGQTLGLSVGAAGMVGGGSDANYTSELTATLDGLGALGDGAHAADEHVVLSALPERAALLVLLLLEPPYT
jgi:glutamate carboxypeptidase